MFVLCTLTKGVLWYKIKMYKIVEKYEGVIIDKPINVKWGNYSQIKCEMLLFKEAFECPVNFDYYHLLSGVDLPLYLIRFNTYIVFRIA